MNRLLDKLSEFLGERPGFLPLLGLLFIMINFLLQFFPGSDYLLVDKDIFLHVGIILGLIGLLLIRPLG